MRKTYLIELSSFWTSFDNFEYVCAKFSFSIRSADNEWNIYLRVIHKFRHCDVIYGLPLVKIKPLFENDWRNRNLFQALFIEKAMSALGATTNDLSRCQIIFNQDKPTKLDHLIGKNITLCVSKRSSFLELSQWKKKTIFAKAWCRFKRPWLRRGFRHTSSWRRWSSCWKPTEKIQVTILFFGPIK